MKQHWLVLLEVQLLQMLKSNINFSINPHVLPSYTTPLWLAQDVQRWFLYNLCVVLVCTTIIEEATLPDFKVMLSTASILQSCIEKPESTDVVMSLGLWTTSSGRGTNNHNSTKLTHYALMSCTGENLVLALELSTKNTSIFHSS